MAGRPKKPEGEARDNILRVRLTDAERAEIDRAAQGKGLESSTWARFELLGLARQAAQSRNPGVEDEPPARPKTAP
jgi:hypothetical protein